jgi:flagellin
MPQRITSNLAATQALSQLSAMGASYAAANSRLQTRQTSASSTTSAASVSFSAEALHAYGATAASQIADADLAAESARLSALQTQQQLGVQSLSIANQAPQSLLALFR